MKIHYFGHVAASRVAKRVISAAIDGKASLVDELYKFQAKRERRLGRAVEAALQRGYTVSEHAGERYDWSPDKLKHSPTLVGFHIAKRCIGFGWGISINKGG